MIDAIKKLVNASDLKNKSDLIDFLGKFLNPKDINLDLIGKDERFTGLLKAINSGSDAKVGQAQNKWKEELKAVEDAKKAEELKNTAGDENKENATLKAISEMQKTIADLINKGTKEDKIKILQETAKEQIKNLSPQSQKMILNSLTSEMTAEKLTETVNSYNEFEKSFKKSGSPGDPPEKIETKITADGKIAIEKIKARQEANKTN